MTNIEKSLNSKVQKALRSLKDSKALKTFKSIRSFIWKDKKEIQSKFLNKFLSFKFPKNLLLIPNHRLAFVKGFFMY